MKNTNHVFCHRVSEIPKECHYVIISTSYYTESPSHGYSGGSMPYISYEAFSDFDEFQSVLVTRTNGEIGMHVDQIFTTEKVVKIVKNPVMR